MWWEYTEVSWNQVGEAPPSGICTYVHMYISTYRYEVDMVHVVGVHIFWAKVNGNWSELKPCRWGSSEGRCGRHEEDEIEDGVDDGPDEGATLQEQFKLPIIAIEFIQRDQLKLQKYNLIYLKSYKLPKRAIWVIEYEQKRIPKHSHCCYLPQKCYNKIAIKIFI
jgi:hypothetical protein